MIFLGKFLIMNSVSVTDMGLFRLSMSSQEDSLCFLKNLSISSMLYNVLIYNILCFLHQFHILMQSYIIFLN